MNWSKAKTILIVVFLIVDIFLFHQTYIGGIGNKVIADKKDLDQIIAYLGKQDIKVNASIPTKILPSPLLNVKYKYYREDEALQVFFGSKHALKAIKESNKYFIRDDDKYFEMNNNGQILYKDNNALLKEKETFNEAEALKKIEQFLKTLDIEDNEIHSREKISMKDRIRIEYTQGKKGMFIDNTFIEIEATDKGVTSAYILWFDSAVMGKTKKEVISFTKLLMKLSEVFKDINETIIIEDVNMGYYFNMNLGNVKEFEIQEIEEGTAIPVWRVKTNIGYVYINAYNGMVEKI